MRRFLLISIGLLLVGFAAEYAQAIEKCIVCHGRKDLVRTEETGRKVSLFVDEAALARSVHRGKECTDCHVDIVAIPHKSVQKVNCRRCHYSGNPVGAPQGELYDQYEQSVHGKEVLGGNPKAPVCQDCHGSHEVMFHDSTSSATYKLNRPATCGRCHIDIFSVYQSSVHGRALAKGNLDAPDCSSCHGEHGIRRPEDTASQVAPLHVAETCSGCHGPIGIVAKYGIKTDRTATFEHSFHGIAQIMQNRTVANCASCHSFHDIRSADDPLSSIHPDNIMKTCGRAECHPEATPQFAGGRIHVDPTSEESGLVYYITKFFTILTVGTLAGLFALILLDLFRRAREARQARSRKV